MYPPPPSRYHTLYGDMGLFILILSGFLGITGSSRCVYQMGTHRVQSGGSVTIACSYSGPEELAGDVQIIWTETDGESCLYTNRRIFSPSGNVTEKYNGRLSREKDPNRNWTEYITMTGLGPTDGPRLCCQIYNNKYNFAIIENRYGTVLQFPDTEHITQLDELTAVTGEEAVIPCYHPKGTSDITSVRWYFADRDSNFCTQHPILESSRTHQTSRYSLVNFPQDISLRIHNVYRTDHRSYCCVVSTAQGTLLSKQLTKLIIAEYQPSWDHPTKEISVQEGRSVTLTCPYTPPSGRYTERDIVRVNVYWRVGNITGPYAYHPYQEMVHSTYIHRTSIMGTTNLMINNVTEEDNTSFHCFVVTKLCASGNFDDKIQYGGGTRLLIISGRDTSFKREQGEHPKTDNNLAFRDLMIIIIISSVTVLIILIVILIVLKVKGVICKKKKPSSEQQMNAVQAPDDVTSEEAPYCEISTKNAEAIPAVGTDEAGMKIESGQTGDGEDGTLLYAQLNQTKLKEKRPAEQPMQDEEVVYSAVVKPTSK